MLSIERKWFRFRVRRHAGGFRREKGTATMVSLRLGRVDRPHPVFVLLCRMVPTEEADS